MTYQNRPAQPRHPRNTEGLLPLIVIAESDMDRLAEVALAARNSAPAFGESLYQELERAQMAPNEDALRNVVAMGDRVTYRDEQTDTEHTVQLVYPEEANLDEGRLSVLSSVGVALIGLHRRDSIAWFTRVGERRVLTVLQIEKRGSGNNVDGSVT